MEQGADKIERVCQDDRTKSHKQLITNHVLRAVWISLGGFRIPLFLNQGLNAKGNQLWTGAETNTFKLFKNISLFVENFIHV